MRLLQEIFDRRHLGRVIVDFSAIPGGILNPTLEDFALVANQRNLQAQACHLRFLSRSEALSTATRVLSQDLAYHQQVMAEAAAEVLAFRFIDLFFEPALFATNGIFSRDTVGRETLISWNPLSPGGLDTGVIGISSHGTGILWVEDED